MKKYILLSAIILLITFFYITEDVLPTRLEISDLEIIDVIGIDYIDDKPSITIIRNSLSKTSGSQSNESSNQTSAQNVATISEQTFEGALELIQLLSDKYVSLAHVEYILIGEDAIKKGLDDITNFLGHSSRVEVNAYIYITEGTSASDFITKVHSDKYTIKDKLNNMMSDELNKSISTTVDIDNLLQISLRNKQDGVLPIIGILDKDSNKSKISDINNNEYFSYKGLASLNKMKLYGYIDYMNTFGYNILNGKIDNYTMKVDIEDRYIVVGLNNFKVDKQYKLNYKNIEEICLEVNVDVKIQNFGLNGNLITKYKLSDYEKNINQKIELIIKDSITQSYSSNIDYFYLEDDIYRYHPYKYRKIKKQYNDNFFELIKKAELVVNVNSKVNTTYDIINTKNSQTGI